VQSQQSETGGGRAERATTDVLQQLVYVLRQCTQEIKGSARLSSVHNENRPTDAATVVCWGSVGRGAIAEDNVLDYGSRRRNLPIRETRTSRVCGAKLG